MCLVTLAIDQSRQYPLVLAFNHDDFFARPTNSLEWWSAGAGLPDILGGRDLQKGGTWLGLSAAGKIALMTPIRSIDEPELFAPSRNEIVQHWLTTAVATDRFWMQTALSGYNGFNLIAADFSLGECFWASNAVQHTTRLERGLYGLSNAALDTPWPKVVAIKQQLQQALQEDHSVNDLANLLLAAMANPKPAHDNALPSTGVSREWEKLLSAAFMHSPELKYGTRSTTLVIAERVKKKLITHVFERTFSTADASTSMRSVMLKDWPPRYHLGADDHALLAQNRGLQLCETSAPKTRVRTLLRPDFMLPKRGLQRSA
jgi:uncharacterized protein with NRDE domain